MILVTFVVLTRRMHKQHCLKYWVLVVSMFFRFLMVGIRKTGAESCHQVGICQSS